ncbi:MAG: lysophospholipid acyltransferase family protein [Prolixibacteraceae bacterium]|jgi:1-acyl-sn-glycerol-3-phosphate acyltransferase|nr:lysophospholipid acyltransferase family protein [Prolixibacteraceae bacterium]
MLNNFFPVNDYKTPENKKRTFWDKLTFGTSIYFNYAFLKIILSNRKLALKNKYDREQWALSSFNIFKLVENCGGKVHIEGLENLNAVKDEPVVFICNHMSTLETMVFPGIIAPVKEVTFVVKDKLTLNPIFGPIMTARNPITVGRSDSRQDLMKVITDVKQKLAEGTSVVIFPQGTRAIEFTPENFNSLGIKLAQKSNVKIVPMAIKTDFWAQW